MKIKQAYQEIENIIQNGNIEEKLQLQKDLKNMMITLKESKTFSSARSQKFYKALYHLESCMEFR